MSIIDNLRGELSNIDQIALEKLDNILKKNPDLGYFRSTSLTNEYQYAPLSTVDCERSFSNLSGIITDKRTNLSNENIEKYLFVNYNQFLLHDL